MMSIIPMPPPMPLAPPPANPRLRKSIPPSIPPTSPPAMLRRKPPPPKGEGAGAEGVLYCREPWEGLVGAGAGVERGAV